jgi:hypothetical protein
VQVKALSNNSPKIGRCIYCGCEEGPLRREHVVPYGLNGPWTLLRASCESCAKITRRLEREALKNVYGAFRVALAMQTRRPNDRPKTLALVLEKDSTSVDNSGPRERVSSVPASSDLSATGGHSR